MCVCVCVRRYDASGWAKAHPGGARWIHWFDGRDATGIFYALHSYGPNGSTLASDRLKKLPKCDAPGTVTLPKAQVSTPQPRGPHSRPSLYCVGACNWAGRACEGRRQYTVSHLRGSSRGP